jgi:hypothetical protein
MQQYFSLETARSLIGRRVRLLDNVGDRLKGDTGQVIERIPLSYGYIVTIEWDSQRHHPRDRHSYFDKRDFDRFLCEC